MASSKRCWRISALTSRWVRSASSSRRQLALDVAQRLLAAIVVAALIPDLGQVEPGAIAHAQRHIVAQQRLEALAGLVVHAELQVQARRPAAARRAWCGMRCQCVDRPRAASAPADPNPPRPSSGTAHRRSAGPAPGCSAACPDRACAPPRPRGGRHAPAAQQPVPGIGGLRLMRALFPILDLELGLLRARVIGDLELQILGADALLETADWRRAGSRDRAGPCR